MSITATKKTTQKKPAVNAAPATEAGNKVDAGAAERLRAFRETYISKNQTKAAKALGIAQSTLSSMESGLYSIQYKAVQIFVEKFKMNQVWLTTGEGNPVLNEPVKSDLITDVAALNIELAKIRKYVQFMEANQKYMVKLIGDLTARIEKLEKKH